MQICARLDSSVMRSAGTCLPSRHMAIDIHNEIPPLLLWYVCEGVVGAPHNYYRGHREMAGTEDNLGPEQDGRL